MRHLSTALIGLLLMPILSATAGPLALISAFAPGEKGGIHAFRFDTDHGTLTPLHRTTGPTVQNPFYLALSPNHRFLYAVNAQVFSGPDDAQVAAFALNGRTGSLTALNSQPALGTATCHLETEATGRSLLLANYTSGSVAALPIRENGHLEPAASFHQHHGFSVHPERQAQPHAHCILPSPDHRFAFAADLGTDEIRLYQLDTATAKLTPHAEQPFIQVAPGSGPRHLTFHPQGRHLYLVNELRNTVTVFDYTAATGRLREKQTLPTLPPDFEGTSHTADLRLTPEGHHLFATNRGHDSIACYRVAPDGTLTLQAIVPSRGKGPPNLLITPDGRWLLCANMPGGTVAVFRIDATTGSLSPHGPAIEMPMPSCIRWVP